MKQREFKTTESAGGKDYYELRRYQLRNAEQRDALIGFLGAAAIPAVNRIGVRSVGVFYIADGENEQLSNINEHRNDVWVLLPHRSLESLVSMMGKLGADDEFLAAGTDHVQAPFESPAFTRLDSSLLLAFDGIPKLEIPTAAATRVFQLRIYESHSEEFGRRKIEMFNEGGEIELFRRVGMTPVFFGEALVGGRLPHLTYMLGFDDRRAGEEAWAKFLEEPAWEKLKSESRYANTVSNITNIWLRPAPCSQI